MSVILLARKRKEGGLSAHRTRWGPIHATLVIDGQVRRIQRFDRGGTDRRTVYSLIQRPFGLLLAGIDFHMQRHPVCVQPAGDPLDERKARG
jgi:hypothetical protein